MNALRAVVILVLLTFGVTACGTPSVDNVEFLPGDVAAERAVPGDEGASISVYDDADVITTGNATVRTEEPESAAADFAAAVRGVGGRIASSESYLRGERPRAEVTVRIPAAEYAGVVDKLGEFGEVSEQSTRETDVTRERVDLEARQAALQASIDRLTELMTGADNVDELLRAEEMLTQRQGELDSLTGQLDHLRDQVDMSTLSVTFTTDRAPDSGPGVWDTFLTSLQTMLYVIVALLPWLVLAAVIIALVTVVWRRRRVSGNKNRDVRDSTD